MAIAWCRHAPGEYVIARDRARRGDRLFSDRLDRAQRHLPLSADGGERRVRDAAEHDRRRHQRPPATASAHCLFAVTIPCSARSLNTLLVASSIVVAPPISTPIHPTMNSTVMPIIGLGLIDTQLYTARRYLR